MLVVGLENTILSEYDPYLQVANYHELAILISNTIGHSILFNCSLSTVLILTDIYIISDLTAIL